MRRSSLLALMLLLVLAAAAAAQTRFSVDGPRSVQVGRHVEFPTRGLEPHEKITVSLAPTLNRGGNCCGIDVIRGARADANGEAILHFRWPKAYYNGSERVRWREGAKADVIVYSDSGRGVKVVRVRGR